GNLGHALASYDGFEDRGFRIVAVFDSNEAKFGTPVGSLSVQPIQTLAAVVRQYKCQIGIIAVPAEAAQVVADTMTMAGIKSILCYAPITLNVPPRLRVEYIDHVIQLQHMTFYLEKGCLDE